MTTWHAAQALRAPMMMGAAEANEHEMRFAVTPSRLGWVLVAATELGIHGIDLGIAPATITERLRARFPEARLREGDAACAAWAAEVAAFIEAPGTDLDLPLAIEGSALQRSVWRTLRGTPPGRTASYGEVAKLVGAPATAQEVAQACASNPFAIAIPCHRVVRAGGALAGYRWGLERKRLLLEREKAVATRKQQRGTKAR